MLEIFIAIILGLLAGTLTGLAPGIHINLISSFLVGSIGLFAGVDTISLVVFIVSMSITHTFLDFIPSIYLGAPEEDSFLSVLPGHKMLKQGLAHEAFVLTLYGSITALPIILILTPVFVFGLPLVFSFLKTSIPFILIFASIYLVLREEKPLVALIVFLLSGFLGFFTFSLPVEQPLLPLLTGLFGLSSLLISLKQKPKIEKQVITRLKEIKLRKSEFIKTSFAAFVAAPLCSFLPGIGSGHAAVLGSEISNQSEQNPRSFLFLVGAINTIVMSLSFVTAYSIEKTRTGSAAAVQQLLEKISPSDLIVILITIMLTGVIVFFLGVYLSKLSSRYINKINYTKLTITIIIILFIFNMIFTNWVGLIVLLVGSAVGVYCILSSSRRINMMGSLIFPTILYYLIVN